PHVWSDWMKQALIAADRVVVVATPEIGAVRNAATLMSEIQGLRPNDKRPHLVLNQTGLPGRQEIGPHDIDRVLKIQPAGSIPFDAKLVSKACGTGKMLREAGPRRPMTKAIATLAKMLSERSAPQQPKRKRGWFG
ncbi:MAG: pilus assembly protein CpaE, partial [Pseudomonadota bacterium]